MTDGDHGLPRRRFVASGAAGVAVLAGCLGGDGDGGGNASDVGDGSGTGGTDGSGGHGTGDGPRPSGPVALELPEGLTEERFKTGPVPEAYRNATSQGGELRAPDNLLSKDRVGYRPAVEAPEYAEPDDFCGTCDAYITDKDGDGLGACSKVEGYIRSQDWCGEYEEIE